MRRSLRWCIISYCILAAASCFAHRAVTSATNNTSAQSVHYPLALVSPSKQQDGNTSAYKILSDIENSLAQTRTEVENININVSAVNQEITAIENTIASLSKRLQEADFNASAATDSEIPQQLDYLNHLLVDKKKLLATLATKQANTQQMLIDLQARKSELLVQLEHQQVSQHVKKLQDTDLRLQKAQSNALTQLNRLHQQLASSSALSTPNYQALKRQAAELSERSNLYSIQLVLSRIELQLLDLSQQEIINNTDLSARQKVLTTMNEQLKAAMHIIQLKLQQYMQLLSTPNNTQLSGSAIKQLQQAYQDELEHIKTLQQQVEQQQIIIEKNAKQTLTKHHGLPGLDWRAWLQFSQKLISVPALIILVLHGLLQELWSAVKQMSVGHLSMLAAIELLWFWGGISCKYYTERVLKRVNESQPWLSATVIAIELVKRNLMGISFLGGLVSLLLLAHVSTKALAISLLLMLTWFGFKIAHDLARLSLLETIGNHTGLDVKLYYRLHWIFIAGGILTALLILVHQLPVDFAIGDFFNRLFMLFLLLIALLLLKGLWLVPKLIEPHLIGKPPYLKKVIRLLCLLFPLSLLITAAIGLLGYVDLAWRLSRYAGMCLLVLTGYMLARGVIGDIMRLVSILAIRQFRNGWLINEAIFKPLESLCKLVVLVLAILATCLLNGWITKPALDQAGYLFHYHLFTLAGGTFTPLTLVELTAVVVLFIWLTRWTPEFAYRWFFARVKDSGARNSLAVFSQYTVVVVGVCVALRVIGIDLDVLKFILGGLAVGIGFGLRDLANNFVSGILLLIERPVRKGDTVTISDYEGEVTHIGMRSITVRTWDHTEVLVPNSEVFSKSFTNWTHQDNIVRITINLRVSSNTDPHQVQNLILATVNATEGVAASPAPAVYLEELEQGLSLFTIHYYIHLQPGTSRLYMRSQVLFAIRERLQTEGIELAHPQQDIYIKGVEPELLAEG